MAPQRVTLSAALALAGLLALAGCTGSGGGSAAGDAAPAPAAAGGAAAAAAPRGALSGRATVTAEVISTAKIRRADITVVARRGRSIAAQADRADGIAAEAGGEVDSDDRTSGKNATARIVMRVPPTRLSSVLTALSRLGSERSRHLTTQDVTSRVADVTSRVTSARTAIARLRSLYARAKKVADVIAIEEELSSREATLESLEAQQRALTQQTATASVTLYLESRRAAPVPVHHRSGFIGGLENGWDAFTRAASWVATAAGAVLPFALIALLLAVASRFVWTRLRPARPATPEPE